MLTHALRLVAILLTSGFVYTQIVLASPSINLTFMVSRDGVIAFSPDALKIALYDKGIVTIVDAKSKQRQTAISTPSKEGVQLAWSHDSQRLAIFSRTNANATGQVQFYNFAGQLLTNFKGLQVPLNSLQISDDESKLLTISGNKFAQAWDIKKGTLIAQIAAPKISFLNERKLVWSVDGTRLLITDWKKAYLFDGSSGRSIGTFEHSKTCDFLQANFLKKSKAILTSCPSEPSKLWDAETGRMLPLHSFDSEVQQIIRRGYGQLRERISPDGKIVAKRDYDHPKGLKLIDVQSGRIIAVLPIGGCTSDVSPVVPFSNVLTNDNNCEDFFFNASGKIFMTLDRSIRLWDSTNGKLIAELSNAKKPASFSNDGHWIITQSKDKKILLWEINE
jgi:WD40 repeat protein